MRRVFAVFALAGALSGVGAAIAAPGAVAVPPQCAQWHDLAYYWLDQSQNAYARGQVYLGDLYRNRYLTYRNLYNSNCVN